MNKVLPHPSFFPQGRRGGGIHLTIITIMCRQILFFLLVCVPFVTFSQETSRTSAIGWPEQYTGVMLQGFSWDNYSQSRWVRLERQAKELAGCFDLVWIPNSGYCAQHNNMGYLPLYYWNQNSSFGTEAELRSLIRTFQQNGIATIADVVINHHNTTGWFGFPQETYKGETYQFLSTDICGDDDGGDALREATSQGVSLSSGKDTGEDWPGCRDLDHQSANVQRIVKAYQDYLLHDLGYAGFRYDMVKGYGAQFTALYNTAAQPRFSVGECWDGSQTIKTWINGTKVDGVPTSAAFDFQFRYRVRDAFNGNDCRALLSTHTDANGTALSYDADYRRWAVTFVENHDTQYRSENEPLDPLKRDTVAANAYMLAMPGTPCVFLPHWLDAKADIRRQIALRKLVGIHSQSTFQHIQQSAGAVANVVEGLHGSLIVAVGTGVSRYTPRDYASTHTLALEGRHYRYFIPNELMDQWRQTEAAIRQQEQAEREEEDGFQPYVATIYCKADFTPVYFYAWDSNPLLGNWPGKLMTGQTRMVDGESWYYMEFDIPTRDYEFNIIFNQGSGMAQTDDICGLSQTRFFTATLRDGKVVYEDVTDAHASGIMMPATSPSVGADGIYDLTGRRLSSIPSRGVYILHGKKIIK